MQRRGATNWTVVVLALAVGFLAALLIVGQNDSNKTSATVDTTSSTTTQAGTGTSTTTTTAQTGSGGTSTTTTSTTQATTPASPQATVGSCIALWNRPANRADQTFLVNLMSQQPVRVHVGVTTDVPPECLVTVVANDGKAYVFPEGGGTTYPYAPAPASTDSSSLAAAQKTSNALEQRDGTLQAR
jgi:hypothetical protein